MSKDSSWGSLAQIENPWVQVFKCSKGKFPQSSEMHVLIHTLATAANEELQRPW